jgi:hypothetical protein
MGNRDPFDDPFFDTMPSTKKIVGLGCGTLILSALLWLAIIAGVVWVVVTVAKAALG